ncbi:AAA family ATPase [Clostridium algidicarnis]|uniref:AAA domain-containing protein n=1 Tax=Clostridium algidicarnis TaxID=37659 RepID=UPI001C0C71DF|nr:AAA domain-containing protein [Clostridium algidicarnis]MBU3207750.1 AAA family ATPase [Clostridium algidicarnis]
MGTSKSIWVTSEIKAIKADEIYNEFYALYAFLKKEAEEAELMFGDGILCCSGKVKIDHPVLLQSVRLEFDTNIPQFKVIIEDRNPELYKSIFSYITDVNYELLEDVYKEFNENQFVPYEITKSNSFMNRLSHTLSLNGKFIESIGEFEGINTYPQIYRKPVLFVRKRNLGFGVAVDSIIEDVKHGEIIPSFLKDIVGIENKKNEKGSDIKDNTESFLNSNGLDKDILLTKPANTEQLLVAKHLETNGAVLVQGPPGTGKTHTIANMIGHLLSQGKSILVTSYSEKALSVLKEKVVDNLQALCLSLLSTTESRREMEKTLDIINENRATLDPASLEKKIEVLEQEREKYINKLSELKLKLKNTRLNEYRPLVVAGKEYSPIEAGKYINKNKENAAWIPLPISLHTNLSLSEEELIELYLSNIAITKYEEDEYDCELPKINELITPSEFSNLISEKNDFKEEILNLGIEFWQASSNKASIEDLLNIKRRVEKALESIDINKTWTLEIIEDSKQEVLKNNWINFINEIDNVYELYIKCSEQIIKYNPKFVELDTTIDVKSQFTLIINKLKMHKKIRRFNLLLNKSLKSLINSCRVNGNVPKKLNEYKALDEYYDLMIARDELKKTWKNKMEDFGAQTVESMGNNFELTCKKYLSIMKFNTCWYEEIWNPIVAELKSYGFYFDKLQKKLDLSSDKYSELKYIKLDLGKKLLDILNSQIYRIKYEEIKNNKCKIEDVVNKYSSNKNSRIINKLQDSIISEDTELYKECYESIKTIRDLGEDIERRRELLEKLEKTAPIWENLIRTRTDGFNTAKPPKNIKEAWLYSQFVGELKERSATSIDKLQYEILDIEKELKYNTSELAFNKAWKFKLSKFNDNKKQVQAIEGWRQLIRKIGAGKGKNAERFKAEARKLMPQCQGAVPVWIMPLNKVVENFNPKENKFDVVIIDEASQADVMAIVALYLAKQVVIVGDNEQVSPLAIGEKSDEMERITKEYLNDMPNHFLYSGRFSIYDLAQASGYQPVRLKEHFRCVPEIIQYSNILSYNGQIKALRETSGIKTKPPIITYRVEDGICNNKTNQKEVEVIVSLILACCENPEYSNKTFGVITLRGEKQAALIDKMIQIKMDAKQYHERNILCGNPANFQGDERDIIFLSMVDSNDKEGPMRLNSYGTDNLYKKRYNVAVSRAKDQLWLIYSMDADNDLKNGDIRKGLINYCKNYKSRQVEYEKSVLKAESEFERRVMKFLIEKGYNIIPQWEVGSFRIDMVAISKENRVAIECDGEKWHGEDKLEDDMNRQAILERLGWRFIRIRGSEFFRNENETMSDVINKLNSMDIYPEELMKVDYNDECGLEERIKSLAEKIRINWIEQVEKQ